MGVKNGINAFGKKNFIGTFSPPFAVLNDFQLLASLPPRDKRSPYRIGFQLDRLLVAAFAAAQLMLALRLAHFTPGLLLKPHVFALLVVTYPWTVWIGFMGLMSFIQHTHPRLAWYDSESEWSFYHVNMTSTAHVSWLRRPSASA